MACDSSPMGLPSPGRRCLTHRHGWPGARGRAADLVRDPYFYKGKLARLIDWGVNLHYQGARSTSAYISKNPAELLFVPRDAKRSERRVMNRQDVQQCFAALEVRERLIVKLAMLAGLRPGEIFGLQWGHLSEAHTGIRQRSHRGHIDSPKRSHSIRQAALSAGLLEEVRAWKSMSRFSSADAWVFPS